MSDTRITRPFVALPHNIAGNTSIDTEAFVTAYSAVPLPESIIPEFYDCQTHKEQAMSDTPKHTPGPWSYAINGKERIPGYPPLNIYQADKTDLISQSEDGYYDYVAISEADAQLIAAAPEMLKALKEARNFVGQFVRYEPPKNHRDTLLLDKIEAAIAKAEGRTP